ncbi:unnamed protein product [Closterium sp. NIES-65]|nr:unnamed protein product [Closterium sp. NIES-65]
MFFMLGLLLDDTFNHVIKHALEMPRPPHTCAALEVCDSHGMPSAHSQFMSFFATFATLSKTTSSIHPSFTCPLPLHAPLHSHFMPLSTPPSCPPPLPLHAPLHSPFMPPSTPPSCPPPLPLHAPLHSPFMPPSTPPSCPPSVLCPLPFLIPPPTLSCPLPPHAPSFFMPPNHPLPPLSFHAPIITSCHPPLSCPLTTPSLSPLSCPLPPHAPPSCMPPNHPPPLSFHAPHHPMSPTSLLPVRLCPGHAQTTYHSSSIHSLHTRPQVLAGFTLGNLSASTWFYAVLAGFTLGILLASTWFYVVHRVLAPFFASPYHSSSLHSPFTPAFQVLAGFTLGILSASFWFYVVHRVFAPFFPTISDSVLAGFTLGILSASFWFYVVHRVFAPFFPAISDSVWGRYLCIKDDCHIRNVAVFEYLNSQRAREEQRAREKAQNAEQEKLLEKSQEKTQEKVQQGKEEEVDEQQGGKQQQSAEESAPDRSAKTE